MRLLRAPCLLIAVLLPLMAARTPAQAQSAHDVLTIGISQFPGNFNPLINSMVAKSYILGLTRRPLTVFDKDWKLVCMLCTKLPTIENGLAKTEPLQDGGGTGIAVTYTIQPDAKWGDGVPVSTDDVIFTWQVGKNSQSGVASAEIFSRIRSIDVKDSKTFTLHFGKVTFDYNDVNALDLLPAHLEKAAFAEPAEYRNRSLYETNTTNPGLYFGPYRITQVERAQYVVLEPNPTWWGAKPYFKRIVVKSIDATTALAPNLLSGGIDMIAGEVGLSLDGALAFETRHRPEWVVIYKPGLSYEHITLNMDNPVLSDKRVRQALLYGLDRESMVKQVYQGKQQIADTLVNPLDWVYDKDVKKYPFDPVKAGQLLDQAGWALGSDGARHNAKGDALSLEIMTTSGNQNREVTELVVQQAWKRLGITVTIRNQPARTFFGEAVLKHAFPDMALFAWISAPEDVPYSQLRSDQVPIAANNFSGQNSGGYKSAEMDKLIDSIEGELDRDKRRALWAQLQNLYAEDLPELPLTFRADPYILPLWLKGIEPTGDEFPTTLWVENWRVQQ